MSAPLPASVAMEMLFVYDANLLQAKEVKFMIPMLNGVFKSAVKLILVF